jgi:hypothetical protein
MAASKKQRIYGISCMLSEKLEANGFEANPAEPCVFNKVNAAGLQISLTLHVDDLLTTCKSEAEIDLFFAYLLRTQFPVITVHEGTILSYLGMMSTSEKRAHCS